MTFQEWTAYGQRRGWVGPWVCAIHDGLPTTADETDDIAEDQNVCIHIMRYYANQDERLGVPFNHPPSVWGRLI